MTEQINVVVMLICTWLHCKQATSYPCWHLSLSFWVTTGEC